MLSTLRFERNFKHKELYQVTSYWEQESRHMGEIQVENYIWIDMNLTPGFSLLHWITFQSRHIYNLQNKSENTY